MEGRDGWFCKQHLRCLYIKQPDPYTTKDSYPLIPQNINCLWFSSHCQVTNYYLTHCKAIWAGSGAALPSDKITKSHVDHCTILQYWGPNFKAQSSAPKLDHVSSVDSLSWYLSTSRTVPCNVWPSICSHALIILPTTSVPPPNHMHPLLQRWGCKSSSKMLECPNCTSSSLPSSDKI